MTERSVGRATVRILAACWALCCATSASAQEGKPLSGFTADARPFYVGFKEADELAAQLDVSKAQMPPSGRGLATGLHWYPTRLGRTTLGIGSELLVSRGRRAPAAAANGAAAEAAPVETRFSALSGQVSLNFGTRDGWSYLTGGFGRAALVSEQRKPAPAEELIVIGRPAGSESLVRRAINYGGGARWFAKRHLAFTFDIRFYALAPLPNARVPRPGTRLLVVSVGTAFK